MVHCSPNSDDEDSDDEDSDDEDSDDEGVTFCVLATSEGSKTTVFLDQGAVLRGGGKLQMIYQAINPTCGGLVSSTDPTIRVMNKHELNFDLGQVYTLESGGNWGSSAEVAMTAESRWFTWFSSRFSARYSAIGAIDDSEEMMEEMTGDDNGMMDDDGTMEPGGMMEPGDMMGDGSEEPMFNPFEAGGGTFEADLNIAFNLPNLSRFAVVFGAGFSSVPKPSGMDLETRQRTFLGLRNSVEGYNAGKSAERLADSSGFLQIGFGTDDLWDAVILEPASADGMTPAVISDESERYILEAQLDLPRLGTQSTRIAVRLYASLPQSGDGPSDVRVSALASVNPRRWFGGE
jgi:hypothetical protein